MAARVRRVDTRPVRKGLHDARGTRGWQETEPARTRRWRSAGTLVAGGTPAYPPALCARAADFNTSPLSPTTTFLPSGTRRRRCRIIVCDPSDRGCTATTLIPQTSLWDHPPGVLSRSTEGLDIFVDVTFLPTPEYNQPRIREGNHRPNPIVMGHPPRKRSRNY